MFSLLETIVSLIRLVAAGLRVSYNNGEYCTFYRFFWFRSKADPKEQYVWIRSFPDLHVQSGDPVTALNNGHREVIDPTMQMMRRK